jgi:hypothetical protein
LTGARLAEDPRFWRGVDAFGAGDYFAAHEEWEGIWLVAEGEEKNFLAGLIQAAVGLLKHRQGRRVGARRLLTRARRRLTSVSGAAPVDVAALVTRLDAALVKIDRGEPEAPPAPLALAPRAPGRVRI